MINSIQPGKNIPDDINVVIEIPAQNEPVKYEFDKETNMLVVDRFMTAMMQYPCNYGFVPNTLSDDGDPVDVLVYTPVPLRPGTMINARPVGVLKMTDESGVDAKIIAVPAEKLWKDYAHIQDIDDLPETLLNQIKHFFEHYKDLESGKWVKVDGFANAKAAKDEIIQAVENFNK
ncbi:inorganic diphosphatase [Thiotrichales bacterium 19S11-10]|nr:inorganic diphosphatase [Thiotrichales bacterium 19S11-10]MCF6808252.1 inorganic diphosphatase [Thiotrichales bacterium 19S9-11]MCF6812268.1 inorganic diphosphatase [Thiotrichales bacterium 19S9-12]